MSGQEYDQLAQNLASPLWPWLRSRLRLPLPYAQRVLNPLAATAVTGECAQLRDSTLMAFGASVFVNAPNSAINYWRLDLLDATGAVVATANTIGATAGQWTRVAATSVTQPAAGNAVLVVAATTVGAPGTIYVVPEVLVT